MNEAPTMWQRVLAQIERQLEEQGLYGDVMQATLDGYAIRATVTRLGRFEYRVMLETYAALANSKRPAQSVRTRREKGVNLE